jgi:hypothetical protein
MSTKQTVDPVQPDPHSPAVRPASTPPWDSPAAALNPSGDFARLGDQIQDLKNVAYASMAPEHQARLDTILTTYTTIRAKLKERPL